MAAVSSIIAGVGIASVASSIGFGAAGIIQSEAARRNASNAARRQQQAQEALLEEQQRRQSELEMQRRAASERDAQISASRSRRRSLGRAGQGSMAVLGTTLAGQAGVQSGGKTLLGL